MNENRKVHNLKKGVFVLSLDLELAWGSMDKPAEVFNKRIDLFYRTREVLDRLLALMEAYGISATWAVVGHLFLDSCSRTGGVMHPEIIRSDFPWVNGDWFDKDPGTNVLTDPIWYAPDIVSKLRSCKVAQELASHSFSHMIFNTAHMSPETARSELEMCVRTAQAQGLELKSFVYPRNWVGYVEELRPFGFTCYRGVYKRWYHFLPRHFRRVAHMVDHVLAVKPPVSSPCSYHGVVNIPDSMLYLSRDEFRRWIPMSSRVRQAKKGIKAAADRKKVFHLWLHPFNLAGSPDLLLEGLEEVFKTVSRKSEEGVLDVMTMAEIAELCHWENIESGDVEAKSSH